MNQFLIYLFLILISLLYCRTPLPKELYEPKIRVDFQKENIPVVFVPGIKGSTLVDNDNNTRWLTSSQALGLTTPDLRLLGDSKDLIARGAVERVTAIPHLIDVDIYGPWLERMANEKGIDFYVFSYDWRKDNLETRDRLSMFLSEIGKKYSRKPVLVGHSMGGMLSFSVVNQNPNLVEKVVYVGVPFRGGIGYMKDLYVGVSTGFNSTIQSPCMIAKYQTVYVFFPRLGTNDSKGLVEDNIGNPIEVDFFKESVWKEKKLGFYNHTCKKEDTPNEIEFQTILDRAKQFRASLDPSPQIIKSNPSSLIVTGENRDTRKSFRALDNSLTKWDMEIAPKAAGDGSVLYEHSIPPIGISFTTIKTDHEHSVMLNDKSAQKGILDFILRK
ncbi:MAG: lecithin--cholesterol acyltransferase [Leptospiraceae bacterium]|nr:lecithin--cholesterol acyltransferase [Leptospiraceae bacterium]